MTTLPSPEKPMPIITQVDGSELSVRYIRLGESGGFEEAVRR
jgi:hypothetical protein